MYLFDAIGNNREEGLLHESVGPLTQAGAGVIVLISYAVSTPVPPSPFDIKLSVFLLILVYSIVLGLFILISKFLLFFFEKTKLLIQSCFLFPSYI